MRLRVALVGSWVLLLPLGLGLASCAAETTAGAQDLGGGIAAQRGGRYEEAIAVFAERARQQSAAAAPRVGWGEALVALGRYEEAVELLEPFLDQHSAAPGVRLVLGRALRSVGRWEEAEAVLRQEVERGGEDALAARLELGELRSLAGDRASAEAYFDSLIDAYNSRSRLDAAELLAVGRACRHLGRHDPDLFKDALKAFDEAIAADREWVEPRVALGELFLEKYNSTEARDELEAALTLNPHHPGALLAMARVLHFDGSYAAMERARQSLETNSRFVAGRIFVAELLLELEDYEEAEAEAEQAIAVDPRSLEAKAVLAAARFLQGDAAGFGALEREVLAVNPGYADFYNLLADACVRNRLYRQAADFGRRAVEVDPKSWRGWGLWGLNELRLGNIEVGRTHLETAFAGDPYNVWIKNTLDLVDTYDAYEEHASARFRLVAHASEAELLAPYALELAEEAYDALARRYGIEPPVPIRLEFYPSHADFSVRTVGLAGMGALGVCFGTVIAQDSPRAREPGDFNWGSTLWHELAHTFTLGVSEHRVPRWLTEGLSVLEERRARPGWGDDLNVPFLASWRAGELLPIAELNNGFVRPTSPAQIGVSYYQASLAAELIEREWGFDSILAMLRAYRNMRSTQDVLQDVLGMDDLAAFDERFEAFLEERFGGPKDALTRPGEEGETAPSEAAEQAPAEEGEQAHPGLRLPRSASAEELAARAEEEPGYFPAQLAYGAFLASEGREEEAIPYLERARDLFPQYVGPDSPYRLLARLHRDRGDSGRAAEALRSLVAIDESDYQSRLELAELERELGGPERALQVLETAVYVFPLEAELHRRMAELYGATSNTAGLVRARAALVALQPTDRAQALFELAQAHLAAGERAEARRQVLRALEIAPAFEEAQRLLLRLHRENEDAAKEATSGGTS